MSYRQHPVIADRPVRIALIGAELDRQTFPRRDLLPAGLPMPASATIADPGHARSLRPSRTAGRCENQRRIPLMSSMTRTSMPCSSRHRRGSTPVRSRPRPGGEGRVLRRAGGRTVGGTGYQATAAAEAAGVIESSASTGATRPISPCTAATTTALWGHPELRGPDAGTRVPRQGSRILECIPPSTTPLETLIHELPDAAPAESWRHSSARPRGG